MGAFISFAEEDRSRANAIKELIERAGTTAWLAPDSMRGTQPFPDEIAAAICSADCVVVVCSPYAASSRWVTLEVNHAMANGKRLLPVLFADFSKSGALHLLLGPLDWVDARNGLTETVVATIDQRVGAKRLGKVITTLNLKGGVGKTTLTANVAAEGHFAMDRSVLFIDLDPQYNLTQYFLSESQIEPLRDSGRTILSLLDARSPDAADIARMRDGCFSLRARSGERAGEIPFDLLAGHDGLFAYTIDEKSARDMQGALANLAAFVGAARPYYNVIMIDVNPSASFLTKCALSVADHVMAPVRPERYALNGLRLLERWLARVRGRPFDSSEISVVVNKMAERYAASSHDIVEQTLRKIASASQWSGSLCPEVIPYSVTLAPSALDEAADTPAMMLARYNRASVDLKRALRATAQFVFNRAGVPNA